MFTNNKKLVALRIVLVIAFFAGASGVQPAQAASIDFGWAKSMSGTGQESGYSTAVDTSGNVYTTGIFSGTVDFDPGAGIYNLTSAGSYDIFISKLDADGAFIWAKRIGGAGYDSVGEIAVDENGNVYTTGFFNNEVDFDPGAASYNLNSAGNSDAFISKLDSDGIFVWAIRIGGISYDSGRAITTDLDGNVYVTGSFFETVDLDPGAGTTNKTSAGGADIFIIKLDGNGNLILAKAMGGTGDDHGQGIALDSSENIHVVGDFQNTVDFDPGPGISELTSVDWEDVFILKLGGSGNFLWAKSIGGDLSQYGFAIDVSETGHVYSVGIFHSTADFDPGTNTYNLTSAGIYDVFVHKLDMNGDFVWATRIGGIGDDFTADIALDEYESVIFVGSFSDTVDFNPGTGVSNLTSAGWEDIFITKLDTNGNFVWAKGMGGTGHDSGNSVELDGNGNIHLAGYFEGTVDFDPGLGIYNLTEAGSGDIFVTKLTLTPQIHYVKWNAAGENDGSSWTDAYIDLQSALSAASAGDEIWVAAGTYKPTSGADRSVSFVLKNGVAVYGGFAGNETLREQRNFQTNVTILSGDIGSVGNSSDNSYHVVVGSNTDNSAVLDGFSVTGGNANRDDLILTDMSRGGGMYSSLGSPTVTNVIFNENNAIFGGGMYNYGDQYVNHIPVIKNVIFSNNTAVEGGGMRNDNYSTPLLTDVSFIGNEAPRTGGGMENVLQSNPTLVNVTFSGNSATGGVGGGMSNISSNPSLINVTFNNNSAEWGGGMANGTSSPNIVNVTFSGNTAVVHGGGISNESNSNPVIQNTILWSNSSPEGAQIYNESGSTATVEDSVVQGGYAGGTNIITADPKLLTLANNGGFTQTIALGVGSPAIDAGDDANCPATDQRGVTRPFGSHCDIGAYEYIPSQPPTIISLSNNTVDENQPVGTTVGTLSTTDPDGGDTFTYSFCGGADDGAFSITGSVLKTASVFDYETKTSYSICIRSTDSGGLSTTKIFTISVNNLIDTQTFGDVPPTYWAWQFIERLYNAGITGGCSTGPLKYCPESEVTRAQMAVFLERGLHYPSTFTAPNVAPTFSDTIGHWAEDWIEALKNDGITSGCAAGLYCPENPVTRAQMAVFLLRAKYGSSYTPPSVGAGTGFNDVPADHWTAGWIKQLVAEGITSGCGGGNYCPEAPVTRAQMAVFLVRTFGLP